MSGRKVIIAKRKKNRMNRRTSRSGKNRTPISGHKRVKGQLFPPLSMTGLNQNTQYSSWINDRLPEMIWAALIVFSFDRDNALAQFRRILNFIFTHQHKEHMYDLTLTGIAKLDRELRAELIDHIAEPPGVPRALSLLLWFDALPARDEWRKHLPSNEPNVGALVGAVGLVLGHQSQEATDCRWVRLMAAVVAGKLRLTEEQLHLADEWSEYPRQYDQNKVAPTVRAGEQALGGHLAPDLNWPKAFWRESWVKSSCIKAQQMYSQPSFDEVVTRTTISELREHLEIHWRTTHSTTEIDPKHDAVFGMAFYSLRIMDEMMGIGIGPSVLGRLGLRTLLEVRINLKYLLTKDTPDLWKKWREYGAGQAKLNALKFDASIEPPEYIDVETIEEIASEDMWEEFLTVNLASWSGLDLRKISERSNLKDTYDQFYSWTSGYSHGMWGAIREASYQICGNPLHRLHRYPERLFLKDTVDDAAMLVDEILQHLDETYPTFERRLLGRNRAKTDRV